MTTGVSLSALINILRRVGVPAARDAHPHPTHPR